MTLQNHPGEVEFPARARVRYARMLDAQRLRPGGGKGTRALLVTALALPFGAAGVPLGIVVATSGEPEGGPAMPIVLFARGMGVGLLVASIVFQQIAARAPRLDQLDYVAQARIRPLLLEEQQLLALDAVSDFSFGGWNSSLAFQPTWAEMPAELRTKHADGATGHEWVGLPMTTLAQHRAALDTQFRIAARDDIELFVADALAQGPQSARFAELAASEEAERMVSRMAALTGRSEFEIIDLHPPARRPASRAAARGRQRAHDRRDPLRLRRRVPSRGRRVGPHPADRSAGLRDLRRLGRVLGGRVPRARLPHGQP